MISVFRSFRPTLTLVLLATLAGATLSPAADETAKIVLVAGTIQKMDRSGHHDYLGGCRLLERLLAQTPGVETVLVQEGWPTDESVFDGADALVFYTDGGGKQAYLASPARVTRIQQLLDGGTGIVSIHQAVEFPPDYAKLSGEWIGALYSKSLSGRGHWDSKHETFPDHPVARGVVPWAINDGWLNKFKFPGELKGITPLVWSSKEQQGSSAGGEPDIVAWTYDRPNGGRAFSFSGLDAHHAWELDGVRKLMINGILWSAKVEIPEGGAKCDADKALVDSFLTPRTAPEPKPKA